MALIQNTELASCDSQLQSIKPNAKATWEEKAKKVFWKNTENLVRKLKLDEHAEHNMKQLFGLGKQCQCHLR